MLRTIIDYQVILGNNWNERYIDETIMGENRYEKINWLVTFWSRNDRNNKWSSWKNPYCIVLYNSTIQ